ncbi:hypothetical protein [Brachybacterium sacelli]|uniref:Esterase YcpF (UPF0227 family) n=1 Tax=Brachybacterium sacelli TaxID=173364 RepID=A0ABS4WVI1_9MICO|nr:hypothetical protein [Brachybacterium sacelli]MBP2380212.1 putative esterase YcpF (UPF0227 family) [Brachybacterium sacelli]
MSSIAREHLTARLMTSFFAPRSTDVSRAERLLKGRVKLGEDVVPVTRPAAYDDTGELARNHVLMLQSLRWLDPLRRVRDEIAGADEAWSRIFEAWSRSAAATNPESAAWGTHPLEQRSVTIALGAPEGSAAIGAIPRHLEMLERSEQEAAPAARRLRVLQVRLALQHRRGDTDEQLQETALRAATETFREDGYAIAEDLASIVDTAGEWEQELGSLGIPRDHPIFERLRDEDFWIHAMSPDGTLVPMGDALPDPVPGAELPQMRYVVTGGEEGTPPTTIRHVDPEGLVSLRSGWGETERDARDETHVSLILGPVRGREAHRDPSRLTYHSQGRDWLIDPPVPDAAGEDSHSIIHVEDVRYRILGGAELVRQYSDDRLDGFVVKNALHLAVQWQRHMVFARTGNYVLVDDTVRSSTEFRAHQQWIVAPDVDVETVPSGFRLHADDKTVSIVASTGSVHEPTVDEVKDGDGARIAWRLRVPLEGTSARAVTIISDVVDPERFSARRVPHAGKEFTVDMADKQLDETLVVTPELSAIVPSGLDPDDAVARTVAYAAAGSLSDEEALEQRLAVRRAVESVKSQIRAEGESPESRRRGLQELLSAAEELRVTGLRDHGLAAALIDIAGTDLDSVIAEDALVGNVRRSALVDWAEQSLVQPSYTVPVRTTLDPARLPEGIEEPAIWSVDLGQLVPSTYLLDGPGDVLTIYFHGATDRSRLSMPRFERMRSFSQLGLGPVMFFSDPCLDLDSRMMLSWYVGNEDVDLHLAIARMIEAYAQRRGLEKVLLVGNSGGGFAALQLGAYLQGTRVVSFNPQIQIDHYVPRIAETAHWALFGRDTVSDDPEQAPRMDLIERYRRIGFDQDVVLIQNPGDDMHHQEHFLPFQEAFGASANAHRLTAHTPYLGPGHRVPPPQEYLDYVREAARGPSDQWSLRGLRSGRG